MDLPLLEYCQFTHPRRSSDFCLRAPSPAKPEGSVAVYGVSDMIGHPTGLRWRNYMKAMQKQLVRRMRDKPPNSLDEVDAILREELAWHSTQISRIRSRHDDEAFGFCVCMAAVCGRECEVQWLGDCRCYHVRRLPKDRTRPEDAMTVEVRCLTQDQNRLGDIMQEKEEFTVFQSETLELSKHLGCFLGIHDDDRVARTLVTSRARLTLAPGECLLLATDGFYMPNIRSLMDSTNFSLTRRGYYLEDWFAQLLTQADRRIPAGEPEYWPEMITYLIDRTLRLPCRRHQYRDDIAVMGLFAPEND